MTSRSSAWACTRSAGSTRPRWRWAPRRSSPRSSDAGVDWKDIQFGFGGSHEVSNPDAVTRLVGLTGITFTNVFNACATAATAIQQTADTIRLGKYDIGIAIGMDKHPRGAFTDDPAKLALPAVVRARTGSSSPPSSSA